MRVEVRRVEAAEVDERWSFVQRKAYQRGLWQAIRLCDWSGPGVGIRQASG